MDHLLRLEWVLAALPQKLTFWFVGKLKEVSIWRKTGTRASNFEASSNLTFAKTSFNDNEIKRELALAFQTEFFLTWVLQEVNAWFSKVHQSLVIWWVRGNCANIYVRRYLHYSCRNISPVQLPFSNRYCRFHLSFHFAEYFPLQFELFLNSDRELDETVFVHFFTRSSFLLPIHFFTRQVGEFELWNEGFFSPPTRP